MIWQLNEMNYFQFLNIFTQLVSQTNKSSECVYEGNSSVIQLKVKMNKYETETLQLHENLKFL